MTKKISCIIVDDEPTAREVITTHLARIEHVEVLGSCESSGEAFGLINIHKVDLIFLDINMPEISGLSFARSINPEIKIIFTTAYRQYAVDGFDLQAVDYLLKPISFERLFRAVNTFSSIYFSRGEQQLSQKNEVSKDFMFVRADRKMIRINYEDICYIESLSDYLKIHTRSGSTVIRETISNIEKELPNPDFIRIHRSFIVSLAALDSYTNEYLEVAGKALPISRSYKSTVLEKLEKWAME
ncbi:LytTR family DNA-binding domain-containing protein [Salinimicrobium sp. MT39]|uniref:LytTR family DNA-binding domain-containing protein n=1 Tax=Salinimicrobium profundisediminis TaxID=2994553 RepID=A0A9X3I1H8_9FLAO|nr:LytTR family DNA-binding domain-containing protein [Salinimicrobium profundisediminis]MCX2838609.1 LytTR family DNA-binding domain-containing protein [Salinimicrobium profundisediminis]